MSGLGEAGNMVGYASHKAQDEQFTFNRDVHIIFQFQILPINIIAYCILSRVTTKTISATFSAENCCLILGIIGLGKNSSFRQQYLVPGSYLMLGQLSNVRPAAKSCGCSLPL